MEEIDEEKKQKSEILAIKEFMIRQKQDIREMKTILGEVKSDLHELKTMNSQDEDMKKSNSI